MTPPTANSPPDESELIACLLRGDQSSYRLIVRQYYPAMHAFARAIIGESLADEVVQESWVSVLQALPQFERRSSLKTWILRIVSNNAKNRLRREKRLVSFEDLATPDAEEQGDWFDTRGHWRASQIMGAWHHQQPEDIIASDQLRGRLMAALTSLPPQQQAAVVLRDMEGMEFEEICKILEVSESNIRVLLHRGRTRLRAVIDTFNKA